ncbi:MAG: DMT family transporter [Candidatus Heimdallarchaeota archaeon]
MQSRYKPQFVLVNTAIIWGISAIFLEAILDYLTPLHTITMRFGIAILILSILLLLFKKQDGFSLLSSKTCILLGWLDAFGQLTATIGQDMTTAGLATLISSSFVFIVPFLAWKVQGSRPQSKMVLLASFALTGIFLISFDGNWANFTSSSILGILTLFCAALFFGVYAVVADKFLRVSNPEFRKSNSIGFLYAILFHTFLPLFILSMITTRSSFSVSLRIVPILLFLAIFPTLIAFSLYNWAIARIGAVRTSFYLLLQVIIPFIVEFVLLQQFYSGWVYWGIFVLLISLLMI